MDMMQQVEILRRVEAVAFWQQALFDQQSFNELVTLFIQLDLAGLFIDIEVTFDFFLTLFRQVAALELRDQLVNRLVQA